MNDEICRCQHRIAGHYSSGRCAVIKCDCQHAVPFEVNTDEFRAEYAVVMGSNLAPVEDSEKVWKSLLGDLTFDVGKLRVNAKESEDRLRNLRRYVEGLERRLSESVTGLNQMLDGYDQRLTGQHHEAMTSVQILSDNLGDSLVAVTGDVRKLTKNMTFINDEWPTLKKKRKAKKRK